VVLAQTSPPTPVVVPDVAWSAFAPELLVVAVALVLLLVAIARARQQLVALPCAAAFVAVGAWLVTQELLLPGGVVIAVGVALPAAVFAFPRRVSMVQAVGAAAALVGALALTGWQYVAVLDRGADTLVPQAALAGALANDGITFFTRITVYLAALLVIPLGYAYLNERQINRAEVEPLLLFAAVGMVALATANDLVTLFVALEVFSLALYVLSGLARRDRRSQEAGLKYFVTGSVASAILLYGMALLYVATGHLDLPGIGTALALVTTDRFVAVLGLGLVTVGIGFKVSLVPFMLWTPDVYQGAPTNITAFMAAATKAAAFAAVLRLYLVAFPGLQTLWVPILAVLAAASMLYGAYVALVQRDLKRMLAYSAITHAGYATIGVVAVSDQGLSATLFYLWPTPSPPRGLRVRARDRTHPSRRGRPGRPAWSRAHLPSDRWHPVAVAAVPGRDPTDRRVRGQAPGVPCRPGRRPHLAGRHRCALHGRGRVLLPAHRCHDVP
jgi:NADH-quinone oxidoreductase subunit N